MEGIDRSKFHDPHRAGTDVQGCVAFAKKNGVSVVNEAQKLIIQNILANSPTKTISGMELLTIVDKTSSSTEIMGDVQKKTHLNSDAINNVDKEYNG